MYFFKPGCGRSQTSCGSCHGQTLPGVRPLKPYFTLAPKKIVSQFFTAVFNMPLARRTLRPVWKNFCQQFLPFAAASVIFIRWSCNTVLAAIRRRKQEGTAAEVNNCSVSEWSSAMMEQVALLAAVAAGQSLDGEGRQGRSSGGEGVGARDSKCEKVSCPSEKKALVGVSVHHRVLLCKEFSQGGRIKWRLPGRFSFTKPMWRLFFFLLVKRMIRVFANFSTLCREPTRV